MSATYERWKAYAQRAGLINAALFAEDAQKAQTSWYTWDACEREIAATQAQASDHTEQALGMVLSDAEIEKEAGNRVGNIAYKAGFVEGAKFALGRTP